MIVARYQQAYLMSNPTSPEANNRSTSDQVMATVQRVLDSLLLTQQQMRQTQQLIESGDAVVMAALDLFQVNITCNWRFPFNPNHANVSLFSHPVDRWRR